MEKLIKSYDIKVGTKLVDNDKVIFPTDDEATEYDRENQPNKDEESE